MKNQLTNRYFLFLIPVLENKLQLTSSSEGIQGRIINNIQQKGYHSFTCTCNYQNNSTRKEARKKLEILTEGSENKKQLIFKALKNVQKEYLL